MSRSFLFSSARVAPLLLGIAACAGAAFAPACSGSDESADDNQGALSYQTSGVCDGLPRLQVETPPGVCVGIAASGFTFARGIVEMENGDLVLAEMGGWAQDRGGVWLLRKKDDKTWAKTKLMSQFDKPSGMAIGPDNMVYVGTPGSIIRFDPYAATLLSNPSQKLAKTGPLAGPNAYKQPPLQLVVKDLPADGRHPLKKFFFDKKNPWTMYVNIGSASDACEKTAGAGNAMPCPEAEGDNARGTIRKYELNGTSQTRGGTVEHVANGYKVIARGLRNSMALAQHPVSGAIIQGENSRDSIEKADVSLKDQADELPHEELNVIVENGHYGWPYCIDDGVPNPEYRGKVDCANYKNPALLLPGHVSPLGMAYYGGSMFPAPYKNNLLVTFHGYKPAGHRLVVVPVDENGIPGASQPLDLIRGWEEKPGNPLGAPVDVMVAKDGSIFVTEDKNGTVLRVVYDSSQGDGAPMAAKPVQKRERTPEENARCEQLKNQTDAFSVIQRELIDTSCVSCHGASTGHAGKLELAVCDAAGNAQRLLTPGRDRPAYVVPGDLSSEFVRRLKGDGVPQMPAGGASPELIEDVISWIRSGAPVPH